MLARRARTILAREGIDAELFRDEDVYRHAQDQFRTVEKIAYMNLARFDPDAFGVLVARDRADDARAALAREGLEVAALEVDPERPMEPLDLGEAEAHPYRGGLAKASPPADPARLRRRRLVGGAIALGIAVGLVSLFAPRPFSCNATVDHSLP